MNQSLPLDMLVCPETHQKLREASAEELQRYTQAFSDGTLSYSRGDKLTTEFTGMLIREDGKVGYMLREGIPVLLKEEAISLI